MPRQAASRCSLCRRLTRDDPLTITELNRSIVTLNPDQYFRGYTYVILRRHATELFQLSLVERGKFCEEMIQVAEAIHDVFKPAKINYEILGNVVPHLHWHLIPRYTGERNWGEPVWSRPHIERRLTFERYERMIRRIRAKLTS